MFWVDVCDSCDINTIFCNNIVWPGLYLFQYCCVCLIYFLTWLCHQVVAQVVDEHFCHRKLLLKVNPCMWTRWWALMRHIYIVAFCALRFQLVIDLLPVMSFYKLEVLGTDPFFSMCAFFMKRFTVPMYFSTILFEWLYSGLRSHV